MCDSGLLEHMLPPVDIEASRSHHLRLEQFRTRQKDLSTQYLDMRHFHSVPRIAIEKLW